MVAAISNKSTRFIWVVVAGIVFTAATAAAADIDLGDIGVGGDGSGSATPGLGLRITTATLLQPDQFGGSSHYSAPFFKPTDGSGGSVDLPYVDGVFLPKGLTPIDSTGGTFYFPGTGGNRYDAIRNAFAVYDNDGQPPGLAPIQLDDQPGVNRRGLGIHANQGITYDLNALRNAGYSFSFVTGVAGLNFDTLLERPSEVWVLVDGAQLFRQTFFNGGEYCPFLIPVGPDDHFLSFACTDYNGTNSSDHGVVADAYLAVPEPASVLLVAAVVLLSRPRTGWRPG